MSYTRKYSSAAPAAPALSDGTPVKRRTLPESRVPPGQQNPGPACTTAALALSDVSKLDDGALCAAVDLLRYPEGEVVYCETGHSLHSWFRVTAVPNHMGRPLLLADMYLLPGAPDRHAYRVTEWLTDAAAFDRLLLWVQASGFTTSLNLSPVNAPGGPKATAGIWRGDNAAAGISVMIPCAVLPERDLRRALCRAIVEYHKGWIIWAVDGRSFQTAV